MTSKEDEKGFLSRWSERKVAVQEAEDVETEENLEALKADSEGQDLETLEQGADPVSEEPEFVPTEEDVEKLDINSDFSKFLQASVPQHIKRMALQKLWRTDPAFAVVDGLLEYGEDFSDLHKKGAIIQSAYQAGRGYLKRKIEAVEDAAGGDIEVTEVTKIAEAGADDVITDETVTNETVSDETVADEAATDETPADPDVDVVVEDGNAESETDDIGEGDGDLV
ncbi:MAG: DUF3306 domain-containing protein [Rhizobiales bacterium]|nr:DUF3306 domain-containing protein [Hyphomicrobiales bacterium]